MIGQTIAGYEVLEELGAGGMGVVYKARHTRLRRLVALKLLPPEHVTDEDRRRRFLREARAASALDHPGIVTIHDVVTHDGADVMVMELVEGEPLHRRIPAEGMPWRDAAELAIELAEAMAAAHRAGIIHRDLKPANVMVTSASPGEPGAPDRATPGRATAGRATRGRIKVLDFGIAKLAPGRPAGGPRREAGGSSPPLSQITELGLQPGTPSYMAPEQILGEPVDRWTDVFSFGVMAYEMLTGERPFRGENPIALADEILHTDPRPVRERRPEVPEALAALVERALAKQPAKRWQSMDEILLELRALLAPATPAADEIAEGARVATLLRSDLVASSALVESTGDAVSAELFHQHDRLARDLLEEHGGREIDKTDGFLLLFDRPWQAVLYALDYHRALAELARAEGIELESRVGIHLGEVVLRRNPPRDVTRGAKPLEVEGLARPTVARLTSVAAGRQTLMTRAAFDLARRSAIGSARDAESLRWLAHGGYLFEGVEEPVEVFEVGVEGVAPLLAPESSEQVTRVADGDTILGWRPAPGLAVPQRPNWKLERKLGDGGFGEVWLAGHEKTRERRAFKFCYEAERLRSLQREITVFRLLKLELGERDDIARMIDWNLGEAPYFIESAFTEGGSLVDWSADRGGIGTVPLEERLELIAQVATALEAAHSVGVLHKDVKPANVLITEGTGGRPRAVLTDFGIGLVTDRERLAERGITVLGLTEETSTGGSTLSGTHLYMAPELLTGRTATIQSDVYALGVMLYQVVVGDLDRPLAPGWERDVDDELLREDIADFADGRPRHRPRSALEVAERLRTLGERRAAREAARRARQAAERSARRRRALAVAGAVAAVFLVVVTVLALQAIRARADAERGRAQAEHLIDYMLGDLHEGLDKIGRLDLLEGVARTSRAYFDSLTPRGESPDELTQRGLTLRNVGDVLLDQGDAEAALATQRSAVALFEGAVARDPQRAGWREGLGWSRLRLGEVLEKQGDNEAALAAYRASLEGMEALAAREPEDRGHRFAIASAHYAIAGLEGEMGSETVLSSLREAVRRAEQLTAMPGERAWRHWALLLDARSRLASMLRFRHELDAAAVEYRAAGQLADELRSEDPANVNWNRRLAWLGYQTGVLYFEQRRLSAALDAFAEARAGYELLVQIDPTRVEWKAWLAEALRMMGRTHAMLDQPETALELYRQAVPLLDRLLADDPTRLRWLEWLARLHHSMGSAHLALGATAEALESYGAARAGRLRILETSGDEPRAQNVLADTLVVIGNVHALRGETEEARGSWLRALAWIEPVTARARVPFYLDTHVKALLQLDRVDEARPMVEELLAQDWADAGFLQLVARKGLAERPH